MDFKDDVYSAWIDFDVTSPKGRKAFDCAVREVLRGTRGSELVRFAAKSTGLGRVDVAVALGLNNSPPHHHPHFKRAVSASLKRGVRDGWAKTSGKGAWTKYRSV